MMDKAIDRDSQQKLYVQVYSIIKGKIEKGEWPAGTQIPTEDELCRTYDVSKATVRMAITELAREGYLKRQQGKGTFVSYAIPYSGLAMKIRLTEDLLGEGVRVKREILLRDIRKPSEDIKNYLRMDDDIYYILCKRVVEGEPAYLEELFIPLAMFPDMEYEDICQTSLYQFLQDRSIRKIFKMIQTIELNAMDPDAASILNEKEGSPVLLLHRLFISADGIPIAYTRIFGTGRKYKIQTEFERIR